MLFVQVNLEMLVPVFCFVHNETLKKRKQLLGKSINQTLTAIHAVSIAYKMRFHLHQFLSYNNLILILHLKSTCTDTFYVLHSFHLLPLQQ